jgi:membrane protein YdbS with pleckstrin-like domain
MEYFVSPQFASQNLGQLDLAVVTMFVISLFIPYGIAELRYKKFIYALGEKDLTIKRGVIEKLRYVVPYEKIQDVTVSRSPLELILGIGTVHIETAGHKSVDGEITLPGIQDYNNLVNHLIEESKRAKETETADDDSRTMVGLLSSINRNLEMLAQLMARDGNRRAPPPVPKKKGRDGELRGSPLLGD